MMRFRTARRENLARGEVAQGRPAIHTAMVVVAFVLALAAVAEVVASAALASASEPRQASSWRGVLRRGDEARARGDAPAARRAYLMALFRARGERSVGGILGAAEGFKALGDHEVVERALQMAAALAPENGVTGARTRRQALREPVTR
jgi:hypothetical protein